MVSAVAVKVEILAPEATVTDPGTVRAALLLESDTAVAPETACVIVTVHVDVAPEPRLDGLQDKLLRLGEMDPPTVILPPVPAEETLVPFGAAADTFVTPMFTVPDALPDSVRFTTATTPFAIAFWLSPESTQVVEPLTLAQLTVFDAAVAAAPADTLKLVMLDIGRAH